MAKTKYKPTGRPPGHPRGTRNLSASNACEACRHESVAQAVFLIASGAPVQAVATQYKIGYGSLLRHYKNHVSERYKKLVGQGPYKTLDELVKRVSGEDHKTLDVLGALISAHINFVVIGIGSWRHPATGDAHSAQLRALLKLRAEITRELLPANQLHAHLHSVQVGEVNFFDKDALATARDKLLVELKKMGERLTTPNGVIAAGKAMEARLRVEEAEAKRAARQIEHRPAEVLPPLDEAI